MNTFRVFEELCQIIYVFVANDKSHLWQNLEFAINSQTFLYLNCRTPGAHWANSPHKSFHRSFQPPSFLLWNEKFALFTEFKDSSRSSRSYLVSSKLALSLFSKAWAQYMLNCENNIKNGGTSFSSILSNFSNYLPKNIGRAGLIRSPSWSK